MNRIKCIFAVLLTGLCISGCTQQVNNQSADQAMAEAVPVKTQSTDITQNTDKTVKEDRLVISSPELNVSLFYENEAEGMFRGVYLRYNGEDTYFEWKTLSTPLFPPSLFLLNSGRHLAVSLVEGEGSGLFLSELHIIDLETREEISFELPIEFLDRNLESRLDQEALTLDMYLNGQHQYVDLSKTDVYFDSLAYGGRYHYYEQNQVLQCDMYICVSPAIFLGNVHMIYKLDRGCYKIETAEFVMDENIEVGSG